jgi:hypothetical protein
MAYVREISQPRCKCGKLAKLTVLNRVNAPQGDYCRSCADRELRALQRCEDAKIGTVP